MRINVCGITNLVPSSLIFFPVYCFHPDFSLGGEERDNLGYFKVNSDMLNYAQHNLKWTNK